MSGPEDGDYAAGIAPEREASPARERQGLLTPLQTRRGGRVVWEIEEEDQPPAEAGPARGGAALAFPTPRPERRATLGPSTQDIIEELRERLDQQAREIRRLSNLNPRMSTGTSYTGHTESESSRGIRPKLKTPELFDGRYSVLLNVLNWITSVERYLEQCRADVADYPGFARTYLSATVQAWMDAKFKLRTPSWRQLKEALEIRYLPDDHRMRLRLEFNKLKQTATMMEYIEKFQTYEAALVLAHINIDEEDKILRFLEGLKYYDEKRIIVEKRPQTLQAVYSAAMDIRRAKALTDRMFFRDVEEARRTKTYRTKTREAKKLNALTGKEKEKAWAEKRCLGCGSPDHFIKDCSKTKKLLHRLESGYKKAKDFRKKKRFHKLARSAGADTDDSGPSEGSSEEEEQEEFSDTEPESVGEGSGNETPESQG